MYESPYGNLVALSQYDENNVHDYEVSGVYPEHTDERPVQTEVDAHTGAEVEVVCTEHYQLCKHQGEDCCPYLDCPLVPF